MNINRHNYEEFFLMYVDNELTQQERSAVEAFVTMNPDLKAELEILKETVLQPEPVAFDKSKLFAITANNISTENAEEYFVEYVNNELNEKDKVATETFVLQHPELQETFTAFKATVLPQEIIEFRNKEVLYRRETKVFAIGFRRMAAAAILIGVIATGIVFYSSDNNTTDQKSIAKTEDTVNSKAETSNAKTAEKVSMPSAEKQTTEEQTTDPAKKIETVQKSNNNLLADNTVTNKTDDRKTNETVSEETAVAEATRKLSPEIINTGNTTTSQANNEVKTIAPKIIEPEPTPAATTVAYQELETEEKDNSVYVGALSINKDKLKGVFRKAGRLFSSKTRSDNEEGKLQVANLEIDTRKLK